MGAEDEALEHARRLVAPVGRARGQSSAETSLYSDEGRVPEHLGIRAEVARLREGLSVTVEVQVSSRAWQRQATAWIAAAVVVSAAALVAALVAVRAAAVVALP